MLRNEIQKANAYKYGKEIWHQIKQIRKENKIITNQHKNKCRISNGNKAIICKYTNRHVYLLIHLL